MLTDSMVSLACYAAAVLNWVHVRLDMIIKQVLTADIMPVHQNFRQVWQSHAVTTQISRTPSAVGDCTFMHNSLLSPGASLQMNSTDWTGTRVHISTWCSSIQDN